jgi:hypothetical protein
MGHPGFARSKKDWRLAESRDIAPVQAYKPYKAFSQDKDGDSWHPHSHVVPLVGE